MTQQNGSPTWIELGSSDQAASLAFYTALFGWTATDPDPSMGHYSTFSRDGDVIGGSMPVEGRPSSWLTYFASGDAEKTAELVGSHGGAVHAPVMDVMDLGRMAVAADPGGAGFGVWQAGTLQGFAVLDEVGAPSWFELHTTSYDEVVAFYRDVLGIETVVVADVPGFRYTTLNHGEHQVAGIMDGTEFIKPGESSWKVYFNVADVDATVTQAEGLGASVVEAAIDTPYGRMASLTDPTGAIFKLRTPPAS